MSHEHAFTETGRPPQDAELFRRFLDALEHPVCVIDTRSYDLVYANRAAGHDEAPGPYQQARCFPTQGEPFAGDLPCPLNRALATGRSARTVQTRYTSEGHPYPVEVHGEPVFSDNGELAFLVAYSLDISERKQLEEDSGQAAAVFHHASEGIMITDARGRIERVNHAFSRITGYDPEETLGKRAGELLGSGWHGPGFYRRLWRILGEEGKWQGEIWNRRKDGQVVPERLTISQVRSHQGQVSHYIGIFTDITEEKKKESRLHRLAYFDALTGLPNRSTVEDRLEQALARVGRGQSHIALLFLDLDGFKAVNDGWGHQAGDTLLREAAACLQRSLRRTDTVARLGGDEFLVLLEGSDNCRGEVVAQKLLAAFQEPFPLPSGDAVTLGLSIGIVEGVVGETSRDSPEWLIQRADQAMYAAKSAGRSTYKYASSQRAGGQATGPGAPSPSTPAPAENELVLFYQPQVDLAGRRLTGLEALLRWQHPQRGLLLPDEFLTEAWDRTIGLGLWGLAEACRQQRHWQEAGARPTPVAVNIAAAQWQDPDGLLDALERILRDTGLEPHLLELEVPEQVLAANGVSSNEHTLSALGDLGVRITIDEFSGGALPLGLLALPSVAKLKLAPAFLEGSLQASPGTEDTRLLETISTLADRFGMELVAKGVETRTQCERLRQRGYRDVQGFFLARPQPPEALEPTLHSGRIPLPAS